MPIYAYQCAECRHEVEVLQKISDAPLTDCPSCHRSSLVKKVTAAGFQLKGSGWYATDFRGNGTAKAKDRQGGRRHGRRKERRSPSSAKPPRVRPPAPSRPKPHRGLACSRRGGGTGGPAAALVMDLIGYPRSQRSRGGTAASFFFRAARRPPWRSWDRTCFASI